MNYYLRKILFLGQLCIKHSFILSSVLSIVPLFNYVITWIDIYVSLVQIIITGVRIDLTVISGGLLIQFNFYLRLKHATTWVSDKQWLRPLSSTLSIGKEINTNRKRPLEAVSYIHSFFNKNNTAYRL